MKADGSDPQIGITLPSVTVQDVDGTLRQHTIESAQVSEQRIHRFTLMQTLAPCVLCNDSDPTKNIPHVIPQQNKVLVIWALKCFSNCDHTKARHLVDLLGQI